MSLLLSPGDWFKLSLSWLIQLKARSRLLSRGWSVVWSRFSRACLMKVLEDLSVRILLLNMGNQCIAVHVLRQPEVPGLEGTENQHHENIENLGNQRISPGLDRIRKGRDVLESSVHTDIRTEAKRAEIFRHRCQHDVELFVPKVDRPLAGNDGIGGVEKKGLNTHLSILSLEIYQGTADRDGLVAPNDHAQSASDVQSGQLNEHLTDLAACHHKEGAAGGGRHELAKGL